MNDFTMTQSITTNEVFMIENISNMLINMTNSSNATTSSGTSNEASDRERYAILGIMGLWVIGVGLFIGARKGYEAIRDGKCNPCGLFKADTTTPYCERTYLNLDNMEGPVGVP